MQGNQYYYPLRNDGYIIVEEDELPVLMNCKLTL